MYGQELWFLWYARRLMMLYISMKFHERFSQMRDVTDGQTDGQTDSWTDNLGKNNMSPPLSGEDIIFKILAYMVPKM